MGESEEIPEEQKLDRLSEVEEKILLLLTQVGEGAPAEAIAHHIGGGLPNTEGLLAELSQAGLVRRRHAGAISMMGVQAPFKWALTSEGKQYLLRRELIE